MPSGAQDLAEQPGDGRLAGAGIAGEHEVVAGLDRRQPPLLAQPLDAQQAGQPAHVGLDLLEADQRVELGEQLLDRPLRRQLGPRRPPPAGAGRRGAPVAGAGDPGRGTPAASNAASSTLRKRSMAAISSGEGTRSTTPRRGRGGCQVVVAGGARRAVAGVGAHEEVEQRARPVSHRPLAGQHLAVAQLSDDTSTGGSRRVPMSSSHGLQLGA